MSYDLVFWHKDARTDRAPRDVYARLIEGQVVGLPPVNTEAVLAALAAHFAGAVREPNGDREWLDWVAPDERSSLQVEWSPEHVIAFCRWLEDDQMNAIIDVAFDHDLRLYDPQTDERFA